MNGINKSKIIKLLKKSKSCDVKSDQKITVKKESVSKRDVTLLKICVNKTILHAPAPCKGQTNKQNLSKLSF